MRRSSRMRKTAVATVVGAAAALAPALHQGSSARAQEGSMPPASVKESGIPPRGQRLRAIALRALDDSIATWKRLIRSRSAEVASVSLRFVPRLGPAYCSGNQTVFVGTREAKRLMARFGPQGEAAITFLIGHEMGHHIQNIYGHFLLLNHVIARTPGARANLVRRFELEADCYAGVWINASPAWSKSARFRSDLLTVLASIGDDTIIAHEPNKRTPLQGTHGTSKQRTRWFLRGAQTGDWRACDVFRAPSP
jgi:predicted metalloprotease